MGAEGFFMFNKGDKGVGTILLENRTPSICHDMWLICTVNTSYSIVLAMYKKILTKTPEISNDIFFIVASTSFHLSYDII